MNTRDTIVTVVVDEDENIALEPMSLGAAAALADEIAVRGCWSKDRRTRYPAHRIYAVILTPMFDGIPVPDPDQT